MSIIVDYPEEEIIMINDWIFTIYLHPGYESYEIVGNVKAGSIDVDLANIELDNLILIFFLFPSFLISITSGYAIHED